MRPLRVDFLYNGTAMSVNQDYQLTCLAIGSEPSAVVTWWIDDVMIPTNHYITEVTLWFEDFIYDISNHYIYGFQLNMICKCAYYFMLISRHRGMKEARSLVTALQIVLLHSRHQCHNTEKFYHAEQKIQCCRILSRPTKEDLIFCVSTCSFRNICDIDSCCIW